MTGTLLTSCRRRRRAGQAAGSRHAPFVGSVDPTDRCRTRRACFASGRILVDVTRRIKPFLNTNLLISSTGYLKIFLEPLSFFPITSTFFRLIPIVENIH